jgi:hypothetical protein
MKEIWIIGSGRFGRLAADRLAQTHSEYRLVLVDPDRDNLLRNRGPKLRLVEMDGVTFLDHRLNSKGLPDWIIPALPIHLAAEWCLIRKGVKRIAVPTRVEDEIPNPGRDPSGNLLVSFADFICPDDCDEPVDACTVTRERRPLAMYDLLRKIRIPRFQSVVVRSYQLEPGVGGYRPRQLFDLPDRIDKSEENILLSTACRCHGVMTGLTCR